VKRLRLRIKRDLFDGEPYALVEEDPKGDLVWFDEIESLRAQLQAAQEQLDVTIRADERHMLEIDELRTKLAKAEKLVEALRYSEQEWRQARLAIEEWSE